MSRGYQKLEICGETIKELLKRVENKGEYRKLLALDLRINGKMTVSEISKATGFAESTIHNLHSRCKKVGLMAGISRRKHLVRNHSYLKLSEEQEVVYGLLNQAKKGVLVTIQEIHSTLEKRIGHKIQRSTAYRMLRRHHWRKIVPKPCHPKHNASVAEEYKKKVDNSCKTS